jgi:hypothetical protein
VKSWKFKESGKSLSWHFNYIWPSLSMRKLLRDKMKSNSNPGLISWQVVSTRSILLHQCPAVSGHAVA